jgi:lactoylglutathione lyase
MDESVKYPGYTHIALEVADAVSVATKIIDLGLTITEEVEYNGARFFLLEIPTIMSLSFISRRSN